MNHNILQIMFLDNPEIPAEIFRISKELPGFAQAEQEYDEAIRELVALIGYDQYSRFEDALSAYLSCEIQAAYLFGLNLRREVLSSLS